MTKPVPNSKGNLEKPNKLCLSCRRKCKQSAAAVIASCPRYYPGPKIKREDWKQMELTF